MKQISREPVPNQYPKSDDYIKHSYEYIIVIITTYSSSSENILYIMMKLEKVSTKN